MGGLLQAVDPIAGMVGNVDVHVKGGAVDNVHNAI